MIVITAAPAQECSIAVSVSSLIQERDHEGADQDLPSLCLASGHGSMIAKYARCKKHRYNYVPCWALSSREVRRADGASSMVAPGFVIYGFMLSARRLSLGG
jgi:hypothetical protein